MLRWWTFAVLCFLFVSPAHARKYVAHEHYRKGELIKVRPGELRPTQFVIGKKEVELDEEKIEEVWYDDPELKEHLKDTAGKVVIGPKGKLYLIDGHHHSRAAYNLGIKRIFVRVKHDWSNLSQEEFEKKMQEKQRGESKPFVRLIDEKGRKRSFKDLPKNLRSLKDDIYRSVVGTLKRAGIIRKGRDFPIYGEFDVADYLRREVKRGGKKFNTLVEKSAYVLTSKKAQAANLPGQVFMKPRRCERLLSKLYEE